MSIYTDMYMHVYVCWSAGLPLLALLGRWDNPWSPTVSCDKTKPSRKLRYGFSTNPSFWTNGVPYHFVIYQRFWSRKSRSKPRVPTPWWSFQGLADGKAGQEVTVQESRTATRFTGGLRKSHHDDPLVNVYITMENHHFLWKKQV